MKSNSNIISHLKNLKGKTVAIVYIFEKEDAAGFQHYWVWKSNIISGWLNAVQELGCLPFILDVRTFIQKAINHDLPHIDFVLNLNCGCLELSSMSLVPAMCSFLAIPCIPCDAASIVISENKAISNTVARSYKMNVPNDMDWNCDGGIYRPLNLGSSIGVKTGCPDSGNKPGTYQEFIPGYDITIPIIFNPSQNDIDLLPPIIYIPKNLDPNWIYDENEKIKDNGFSTYPMMHVDDAFKRLIQDFVRSFPVKSFGRIDMRLKSHSNTLSYNIVHETLSTDNMYFIEINAMPTIEKEDSFEFAITLSL